MNEKKESEAYRVEMLLGLLEQNPQAEDREGHAQIHDAIVRLGSALPEPDACPECYYFHGRLSVMQSIPPNVDVFSCHDCGFLQNRYAR